MRTNTAIGGLGGSPEDSSEDSSEDGPGVIPGAHETAHETNPASKTDTKPSRPSFVNPGFIQTVVNQAICIVNNASEERGEFIQQGEFSEPVTRHLDLQHEDAFHSACNFLAEYFNGARNAISRENRLYSEWADNAEREFRDAQ